MKEEIKKNGNLIFAGTCVAIPVLALLLGRRVGYKHGYAEGFQDGCNTLFCAVVKEFPGLDLHDFVSKYRK